MVMDLLRGLDVDNASDFDGLEVLNKIKACLNDAAGCSKSDVGAFGQSLDELREAVSLRLANQTDLLSDYRALSDMPFPVSFDNKYIVCICLAYAIIIVTSILGNVLVCYVIIKMRRMHTVTNLFILNLAVSDLLITCLNIPFSLVRLLMDDWPLGSVLCQLLPFVQITAVYVSSWTMVCIAYDRLRVIVFPLRPRLTFRAGVIMVIVMWILASLMSAPYAAFHQVTQFQFAKPTKLNVSKKAPLIWWSVRIQMLSITAGCRMQRRALLTLRTTVVFAWGFFIVRCAAMYPSGLDFRQYLSLGTFILQFFIPLNITGFSYGIIGLNLWSTKAILKQNGSHQTNHLSSILRNRQKTIKMLVAVVMVFAGCWLPISLYHLTRDFNPQNDSSNHNVFVFFILHWLAMSSVAYNPAIYCCWNQCYRSQAKRLTRLLCQCCICCWRSRPDGTSQPKVRIEGLIVRFSRKPDYPMNGSIEFSQRSYNWDSINGVKEIIHVQEGKRTYSPAQRVAL